MHQIEDGMDTTMSITGPVASFGGILYAVATDTFWVGVVTFIATVAGVVVNLYKAYHDVRNKSLESKLEASMASHKKEIEEVKAAVEHASGEAYKDSIAVIRETFEKSLAQIRKEHGELIDKLSEEISEVKTKNPEVFKKENL